MVQIGNFHIGRYDSAQKPTVSIGEAYAIWDNLVARYDWDDSLQMFYNYAHDPELQKIIQKLMKLVQKQSATLEEQLALYQLPLPPRPRETIQFEADSGVVKDEFIYRRIFSGFQDFLSLCSTAVRNSVVNDSLREIFIDMLLEKIYEFDELCIITKKKGWAQVPPQMKIT
ncbi:MAG: hypothetical protein APF84_02230 [Gracilibacter sp. BRH_c7a]|nr:MAG: hypothetical protein APF84_02230 [Gracilibacter sp. BRH_c7a]